MAKAKTKNRKRNTDGDDLIDDDAVSVAVAEKPAKKAREATKKQTANPRKTGPTASKRAEAKAKKSSSPIKDKAEKPSKAKVPARGNRLVHTPPKAGKVFTRSFKGKEHKMTIKAKGDGIVYVVQGKSYPSARRAASAVTGAETNGWTFWDIIG